MRNNLIKLLRKTECESCFENIFHDRIGFSECDYEVMEHMTYPNYSVITKRYNEIYPLPKDKGLQPITLSGYINSELKRMEMDGIIMIGIQRASKSAQTSNKCGPDHEEIVFKTESVILTTKGKSNFKYLIYKAADNPVVTIISFLALVVSVIALLK